MACFQLKHGLFVAFIVLIFVFQPHGTAATARKQLDGATAAVGQDPKPIWHRQFSIDFNETTKLLWWRWSTEGSMLYDALQQVEVVHRANGKGDRYCLSIHPRSDAPCTHLVVSGQRYLIFPELGECCKCCSSAGGCGILDPDWLDAAEYTGQTTMQGRTADSWTIRGLQPNNYYATADVPVGIPLELDQLPNDYITFHPDTLKLGPVSPKDVIVPEGCAEKCPLTSVCTILQAKASLQAALGWRGQGRGAKPSSSRAELSGGAAAVV
ncbi:hypothetical protein OEZ85_000833 [Tetradesmus obliquus]|uniref:Phospholipid scramblase n=1 Tax=Tetradesmus obliquus TaxID=3088 RepID=A0ABY8UN04_TETOB|nr:hypothetical protein OEZ85_000833 [Tetradesmus obliquus]